VSTREIHWEDGDHSTHNGYVITAKGAKIRVFTINWSIRPDRDNPWVMRSTLPGFSKERYIKDIEQGKRIAQQVLNYFASVLNGEDPAS
jgi:hypothetical protein